MWASECALVPSLGPVGGRRAGARHHVGNLEVTFVSLPASLPWIRIRCKMNVSQNLPAKTFDVSMKQFSPAVSCLCALYIFAIICSFQIGEGIKHDCHGPFSIVT